MLTLLLPETKPKTMPILYRRQVEPKPIGGKEIMMQRKDRIMVLGHRGLIGSAIVRNLKARGFENIIIVPRAEVDLTNPTETEWMFSAFMPDFVFMCAARVGGIAANMEKPVEFFIENIQIQNNVIVNAAKYKTQKLLFLGSSCIYPAGCKQPIREDSLLTGRIDPATEPYGLAKACGIRLCQWHKQQGHNFISALPSNVYGPNDNYNPESSHCVPGLLGRMVEAVRLGQKEFIVWGDGTARREVIYSDDLAEALVMLMECYSGYDPVNAGSDDEITIRDMARTIARIVGFTGELVFDSSKPSGVPSKVLDNRTIRSLGWYPSHSFVEGLAKTYDAYLTHQPRR